MAVRIETVGRHRQIPKRRGPRFGFAVDAVCFRLVTVAFTALCVALAVIAGAIALWTFGEAMEVWTR